MGLAGAPPLWLYASRQEAKGPIAHVAFGAASHAAVYSPSYDAAFLADPDGNNIEVLVPEGAAQAG